MPERPAGYVNPRTLSRIRREAERICERSLHRPIHSPCAVCMTVVLQEVSRALHA